MAMQPKIFFSIAICFSTFFSNLIEPVRSQEQDKPKKAPGFLDIDSSRFPAAITAELINGTIKYIDNKRRAKIELKWDLLPLDNTLEKQADLDNVEPIACQIRNEDLGESGTWFEKLDGNCKKYLVDAKIVDTSGKIQSDKKCDISEQGSFQKLWLCEGGAGYGVAGISVPSSQYFGLLRDRLQLTGLLNSQGINYRLKVDDKPTIENDKNIIWNILIYKLPVSKEPILDYYRFVVRASILPNDIYFPADKTQATIKAIIELQRSTNTIGIFDSKVGEGDMSLEVPLPTSSNRAPIDSSAATELTRTLSLVGGPQLGEVVTNNFLGGSRDASLVYGGMIAKNNLEPILGANLGLANIGDNKFGALIGVGTNSSSTFYIGPSFQTSILTLSGGVRLATNGSSVDTNIAGVFSLDLSQLFGGKREVKEFEVARSSTGGNWGLASDSIYKNLALIDYKLIDSRKTKTPVVLSLTQVKTCDDKESNIKINLRKDSGLQFIPRGNYKYNEVQGYDLKDSGIKPIAQAALLSYCSNNGKADLILTIQEKKN